MSRQPVVFLLAVAALLAVVASPTASAGQPLLTGVLDPSLFDQDSELTLSRVRAAGTSLLRLPADWRSIAPGGKKKPVGFLASNPADPRYGWAELDLRVTEVVAHGLEPILVVHRAPDWAEGKGDNRGHEGSVRPSPKELAAFATAVAVRYSGAFAGLPQVRYWQAWNEPNLTLYINPQFLGDDPDRPFSPGWYRQMVNAFADAVHAVDPDNLVVAGGLAPFTDRPEDGSRFGYGPLAFMRTLLCLNRKLERVCSQTVKFDIWGHHPYTSGGPTHQAFLADDVSLGDLPEMNAVLQAGVRQNTVRSKQQVRFWVLEFSWDSKPPDVGGVPAKLQARWVAEALYRSWKIGIDAFIWYRLRDETLKEGPAQSGLYYNGGSGLASDRPKLALKAFRFPFVAFTQSRGVLVWGRTPWGLPGPVVVEQASGSGWTSLGQLEANEVGIFTRLFASSRKGSLRARLIGASSISVPFSLTRPPDLAVYPFGSNY